MTRNLAPLAPDLVDLLTHCGQAVDPNLVKLQEAYHIIQRKLQDKQLASTDIHDPAGLSASDGAVDAKGKVNAGMQCCAEQEEAREGMLADSPGKSGDAKQSNKRMKAVSSGSWGTGKGVKGSDGARIANDNAANESPEGVSGDSGAAHVVGTGSVTVKERKNKQTKATQGHVETGVSKEQSGARLQSCVSKGLQENGAKCGLPDRQERKRRRRAEKRAAAVDAGTSGKKHKHGILGAPKAAELTGVTYDSGQESD